MTGLTGATHLLEIGQAMAGREYDETRFLSITRTDSKGLVDLDEKVDGALRFALDGLSTIGAILAYCDHKEIVGSMPHVGFLIDGLSDLARQLAEEKIHLAHEMLVRSREQD